MHSKWETSQMQKGYYLLITSVLPFMTFLEELQKQKISQ